MTSANNFSRSLAPRKESSTVYYYTNTSTNQLRKNNIGIMDEQEIIKDPWCDLDNPRVVKFEEISAAAYRIRDGVVRTPCDVSFESCCCWGVGEE